MISVAKQKGLTLIEIMVALSLGLLVIASILQILSSSRQSYRLQEQSARLQENERFSAEILSKSIRLAGYRGNTTQPMQQAFPAATNFSAIDVSFEAGEVIKVVEGKEPKLDQLVLRYQGSADGGVTDCLGRRVCDYHTVVLSFHLNEDKENDLWSLRCTYEITPGRAAACSNCCAADGGQAPESDTQPMVANVEDISFFFGLDSQNPDPKNRAADSYRLATDLSGADWNNLASVRIALLLVSDNNEKVLSAPQKYTFPPFGPDKEEKSSTDYRLRRVLSTTIPLSNLLP